MRPFMQQLPFRRSHILSPKLLDMDERPLSAAEGKMLQPGELEVIVLPITHDMRIQVTPWGRRSAETVTL